MVSLGGVTSDGVAAIAERFGLGPLRGEPRRITRGAVSNRLWRVWTENGCFVVKEMVSHADREWFAPAVESAFAIELRARRAGVVMPEPVPDPRTGRCLARVGGRWVRVHRWLMGRSPAVDEVDAVLAGLAGELVAGIHLASEYEGGSCDGIVEPIPASHWYALADRIVERVPVLAERVRADAGPLSELMVRTAVAGPPDDVLDSHADLDPKNTLLCPDGSLAAVDWDAARPVSAGQELVAVALDWSVRGTPAAGFDPVRMRSVLDGYRSAGGPARVVAAPEAFGAWVSSWVWWLDFQLEENIATGAGLESGIDQAMIALNSLRQASDELDVWTTLLRAG